MDKESFVRYWHSEDVHDGKVRQVIQDTEQVRVLVDTSDGRLVTFEFSGVESVSLNRPEGMLLYSLTEIGSAPPHRKFVFTNWEEDDEARLEVMATDMVQIHDTSRQETLEARQIPIACNLNDSDFQERRAGLLGTVKAGVVETKELEDGYAYHFPSDVSWLATLANLITVERACCPFLRFNLRLEPAEGPIWLELTGPPGTKDFLNSIFGD